jgi:probable rRNA maturation factor
MGEDLEYEAPVATRPGARVELIDATSALTRAQLERLRGWLERAIAAAGSVSGEVRVRLVGDPEMAAAHERYAGIPGATDVLTFDMRDEEEDVEPAAGTMDVDIWACVDEAARQAAARGIDLERELLLYCIHGVLHCLGYDDHGDDAYARMHAEEDRILEAIGVGRTFGVGAEVGTGGATGGGHG